MRHSYSVRGPVTLLAISLASSWSMPAAFAACGMAAVTGGASGPPSISATETSTTQVLEQIRRRTQTAQEPQPIPVSNSSVAPQSTAPAAQTTAAATPPPPPPAPAASAPVPAAQAAAATAAASAAPKPKPAPAASSPPPAASPPPGVKAISKPVAPKPVAPKAVEKVTAPEPQPVADAKLTSSSQGRSLKDDDYGVISETSVAGGVSRTSAVWAQAYLGYDRHSNIAPGNQENPTRSQVSGGGLIGADWTSVKQSQTPEAVQVGVFSGYNETRARHSDTFFFVDEDGAPGLEVNYFRSDYKEEIDGPFIGAYMAYVKDTWTFDVAIKADFFDLTQSSMLTQRCGADFGTQNGSASVNNYMIAANVAHRHELSERSWYEPVFGMRFTHTDFGNDPSNSSFNFGGPQPTGRLGLEDGSALRLQAGVRYGERGETAEGYLWTMTFGAFLYSDVLITGFESVSGQTGEAVGPVDEGKLRALGQFETKLDVGNGVTYLLQAEVRGGEDVFGAAGQLGVRYKW